jgi:prepilin-type N-terminal cleavage/methylation domain-containing protein
MMRRTIARLSSQREGNGHVDRDRGFTLIELLTVVVVVGVVSTVAAMALGHLNEKSISATCQADGTKISNAVATVKAQYPGTVITKSILITAGGTYEGPYLESWPGNRPNFDFYFVAGVLNIQSPSGSATTSGTTLATGEPFTGLATCTSVTS